MDSIKRKKNTGEPGNKGQFGSKGSSESDVSLGASVSYDDEFSSWNLASDPSTSPETLAELAGNSSAMVRWATARNPSTPRANVVNLYNKDIRADVREAARGALAESAGRSKEHARLRESAWRTIVGLHTDLPADNPEYARGQIEVFAYAFGPEDESTDMDVYKEELWVRLTEDVQDSQ